MSTWWWTIDAAISGASVTPASLYAGASGTAAVTFTTGLGVPNGGSIKVVFPPTFTIRVSSAALVTPSGINALSTLAMGSNTYTIVVSVAGEDIPGGTSVSFSIDGVSNPGDGTTSKYTIRTTDAMGGTIESTTNVPGSVISKTALADAVVTFSTSSAGAKLQLVVSFTTTVVLLVGSRIELQFPTLPSSTFVISSVNIASRTGLDAACSVLINSMPFLQVAVRGQDVVAATAVSISFDTIYNPAAQTIGTFAVRTHHPSGGILQEAPAISAQDGVGTAVGAIHSTLLSSSAAVTPTTFFGGMRTTFTVRFSNAAYLVSGAKFAVTFPARFDVSDASLAGTSNIPSSGSTFSLAAQIVIVSVGAGVVEPGSDRGFSVANIVNPGTSCSEYIYEYCSTPWESYAIAITDAADQIYELSVAIPGSPIVKKPMMFARVRPLLKLPLTPTSAVLDFTTEAAIPQGGKIEVVFPTGFQLGAVVASGHVGIPSTSLAVAVAGLQLSLTVAGASIPPSSQMTVTFSAITTPDSSATGMYVVRTRDADAQGNVIEEHDKVNGEGCLYLNSCYGHGVCTLFSSTCICDPGWGSQSDVASYRSPDCSLRTCPSGKAWNNLPSDAMTSHNVLEECSGMGTCDRNTGRCVCFEGFVGSACQRLTCPNNCRNRGKCVTMRELASIRSALPLSASTTYSGSMATWDEDRVFGCTCDSGWAVGTGSGEVQATEYFGGDCSLRHCPTGNDPETAVDETDCTNIAAPGGFAVGDQGNICHVECSNRGICNIRTGVCRCFVGYSGFACQTAEVLSK